MRPNKQKTKVKQSFSINQLAKLETLFRKKNWPIDTDCAVSTFERYTGTLSELSVEQQDFVLNLSERFLHIGIDKYAGELVVALKKLRTDYPNDFLLVSQCLPEADLGKSKSGDVVLYQFRGNSLKTKMNIENYVICSSNLQDYLSKLANKSYKVVLVDDFIGTGETALEAVKYVKKLSPTLKDEDIVILCIVAMQAGIEHLAQHSIRTYCSHIEQRGISDYYEGQSLEDAVQLMNSIEEQIKVKADWHFGYGQSEALVSMERCPNNTFPIYWLSKNAPYAR